MQKIKYFLESQKGKNVLIILIIILVGLGSFGLGRLSKNQENKNLKVMYEDLPKNQPVTISNPLKPKENKSYGSDIEENTSRSANIQDKGFVASKVGSKYYPFGCDAGDKLKEENKIYFSTEKEAIDNGYTRSSSC